MGTPRSSTRSLNRKTVEPLELALTQLKEPTRAVFLHRLQIALAKDEITVTAKELLAVPHTFKVPYY